MKKNQPKPSDRQSVLNKPLRLFATGFAMGSADIVPGVSGGTVALLLGVYEQLIESIKTISGQVVRLAIKGQVVKAFHTAPLAFLVPLGLGILSAIFLMSSLLQNLLHNFPVYTWSMFFGLVVASAVVVQRKIKHWQSSTWLWLGAAALATYATVGMIPIETPATPLAFFLSGAVAICAMILPGISGSFLLLMLGKYQQILAAVTTFDLMTLAIFALGAVLGLSAFSRVLSYLFKRHHDQLVAVLTGMLVGSLRKIWPWKQVVIERLNSHGELVPVVESNYWPDLGNELMIAVGLAALAFGLVWWLGRQQGSES